MLYGMVLVFSTCLLYIHPQHCTMSCSHESVCVECSQASQAIGGPPPVITKAFIVEAVTVFLITHNLLFSWWKVFNYRLKLVHNELKKHQWILDAYNAYIKGHLNEYKWPLRARDSIILIQSLSTVIPHTCHMKVIFRVLEAQLWLLHAPTTLRDSDNQRGMVGMVYFSSSELE